MITRSCRVISHVFLAGAVGCFVGSAMATDQTVSVEKAVEAALVAFEVDRSRSDVSASLITGPQYLNQTELSSEEMKRANGSWPLWRVSIRPARAEGVRGWESVLFLDAQSGKILKQYRR